MPQLIQLHPMIVHFPIALLVVGTAVDLLGTVLGREDLVVVGKWNIYIGAASLLFVVATGLLAEGVVGHSDEAHRVMTNHKNIGFVVLALFGSLAVWRAVGGRRSGAKFRNARLVLSIIGVLIMTYGADLGAKLVYEYGVAVSAPSSGRAEHVPEEGVLQQETHEESDDSSHEH